MSLILGCLGVAGLDRSAGPFMAARRSAKYGFGMGQSLKVDLSRLVERSPSACQGRGRHASEFRDETDTAHQQNTTYDAARVEWMRLHSEPAEMVDQQRCN